MRGVLFALIVMASTACGSGGTIDRSTKNKSATVASKLSVTIPQDDKATPDTVHLGRMKEGEIIKSAFDIQNTTQEPLVIVSIRVDCGCARATFDTAPIMAGENRRVDFTFNSAGRPGMQIKYFDVQFAGGEHNTRVYLDAEVEPKK